MPGEEDIYANCRNGEQSLWMGTWQISVHVETNLCSMWTPKMHQKSWVGRLRFNLWDAMGGQPRYVLLHHGVHDLLDPAPVLLVYYVPCGACARSGCLQCPIRGVVRLSGTFWLVLSSFFRWQVPSVNLPKLGLDCPPDSTRLHQTAHPDLWPDRKYQPCSYHGMY